MPVCSRAPALQLECLRGQINKQILKKKKKISNGTKISNHKVLEEEINIGKG